MKGVEAPFQLMVSVFTMVLVLIVAYQVLKSSITHRCEDQWRQNVSALAGALQSISVAEYPSFRDVSMELACGQAGSHRFEVRHYGSVESCVQYCGEAVSDCYAVYYEAYHFSDPNKVVSRGHVCIPGFSPYSYSLLINGTGECTDGTPFFTYTDTLESGRISDGRVTLLVERGEDYISVCRVD